MFARRVFCLVAICFSLLAWPIRADESAKDTATGAADAKSPDKPRDEKAPGEKPADLPLERLVEQARKSIAVISFTGRDGQRQGMGSGFIISTDGLIATNYHVLGEGRPLSVQLADGKQFDVAEIRASDRALDLAILRIEARDLPALPLGNSDELRQGQSVVALGNPQGLKHSVVSGIVSGLREVEGRSMIQLAIPIEPGNSGGPIVDLQGRVHGIVTMKSAVTPNLGFALAVNLLKPLLQKPNPIPINRWLTIGALNPREWQPLFGTHWRRRTGHLFVDGVGEGFGGRSLCLHQGPATELPCELTVSVRLDDESGAAGLAFCGDGQHKHFGFYPTGGKLRLTRFDGPDLLSWTVLYDQPSRFYQPGQWNTLCVRLEKGKLRAYANDHLIVELDDDAVSAGKLGLVKFRQTQAEFKGFYAGKPVAATATPAEEVGRVTGLLDTLPAKGWPARDVVNAVAGAGAQSPAVVRERARLLEQHAAQLRQLGQAVESQRTTAALVRVLDAKEEEIDLFHAAPLISKLDNQELDVEAYRQELTRVGGEIAGPLAKDAEDQAKLAALRKYLFEENGFHGSRHDYYNRANSYLNEVLDDREGLPITLSVLYLELARRLGVKVEGVGLPGHFVVRYVPAKGEPQLIDVYDGAKPLSRDDAALKVATTAGRVLRDEDLAVANKRAIMVRMLHNLLTVATSARDTAALLRYLDAILALDPQAAPDRWMRAQLGVMLERRDTAQEDIDWLLEKSPAAFDLAPVRELKRILASETAADKEAAPAK